MTKCIVNFQWLLLMIYVPTLCACNNQCHLVEETILTPSVIHYLFCARCLWLKLVLLLGNMSSFDSHILSHDQSTCCNSQVHCNFDAYFFFFCSFISKNNKHFNCTVSPFNVCFNVSLQEMADVKKFIESHLPSN